MIAVNNESEKIRLLKQKFKIKTPIFSRKKAYIGFIIILVIVMFLITDVNAMEYGII